MYEFNPKNFNFNSFEEPKYSIKECRQRGLSFEAPLKVVVRLVFFDVDVDKDNIVMPIQVDAIDACTGCSLKVDTFDGKKTIKVPTGVQEGNTLKIKELGFPKSVNSSARGDLLLKVKIVVPKNLTISQIEKLKEIKNV